MVKEIPVREISKINFADCGQYITNDDLNPAAEEDIFVFWDGLGLLDDSHEYEVGFLEAKNRENYFSIMERHLETKELFFALDDAVILTAPPSGNKAFPDLEKVRALKIESGSGVIFDRGAWHWIPFPLQKKAQFVVIFKKNTPEEDLEKINLQKEKGIEFKISY